MDVESAGENSVVEEASTALAGSDLVVDDSHRVPTPEISPFPSPIPGLGRLPGRNMFVDEPKAEEVSSSFDVQFAPKETPPPVVQQLSLALIEIRQEIAAGLIKEEAILQALKNLDAPAHDFVGPPPTSGNDFSKSDYPTPPTSLRVVFDSPSDSRESAGGDAQN
ncbi:hypothetical protein B0H19DRAFT_163344 [Mycena capillaripes]|nr:hypothetical protein B0H19DRAFT_163344 [Mycena capillaripes]